MCDDRTEADNRRFLDKNAGLSRRKFTHITAATGLAVLWPSAGNASELSSTKVNVTTPDGMADCHFVHPKTGAHPGVIVWPDVLGLRPAFELMADRLALAGYSVLVVNPYYRNQTAPVVVEGESFADEQTRNKVIPLARGLSPATNVVDARAFVAFLDEQEAVDTSRPIGTTGYCMGGPITIRTAAAVPARIGAGASFHGGRLVTQEADSPHLLIPKIRAQFLFAIADNDDEKEPATKDTLKQSFAKVNLSAEIEVYEGALHGWCPPDSRVYNEEQAEKAWARLLHLFGSALA